MLHFHIKRTIWGFVGLVGVLIVLIIGGSFFLEKNNFIGNGLASIQRKLRSTAYIIEYSIQDRDSLRATAVRATQGNLGSTEAIAATGNTSLVPVFVYHGIVKKADRFSLTEDTLKDQLFTLKRAGYQTIGLKELYDFQINGTPLPGKSFVLTFDDGRRDSYRGADPLLKALGYKAVMFVATDPSVTRTEGINRYYINDTDIKSMLASGRWEIGSHAIQDTGGIIPIDAAGTKGNFLSNKQWLIAEERLETDEEYAARINREFKASKEALEKRFGVPVIAFSYPFGDYGQQTRNNPSAPLVIAHVAAENYQLAFQQVWSNDAAFTLNRPKEDLWHLRRIEVPTDWTGTELVSFLSQVGEKPIGYADELTSTAGWKSTWGEMSATDTGLRIAATERTTGALVFLDGTQHWRNYFFAARGEWEKGDYVTLIARYQDDKNYKSCIFSDDAVRVTETVNGIMHEIDSVEHSVEIPKESASFGILVDGQTVKCYIGSRTVAIAYNTGQELAYGGIAIKMWDETSGNSSLMLDSIVTGDPKATQVLLQALPRYVTR